jgi:hypothetical protein
MWIAPCVNIGHNENAMFAAVTISLTAIATAHGNPPPP